MKIVVLGATGFIGKAAVVHLATHGHEVVSLVRRKGAAASLPSESLVWDTSEANLESLVSAVRNSDAVIYLSGESVAKSRWTTESKALIRSSRVTGTKRVVEAIASLPTSERPKVLISGSAIGYYGHRGDEVLTEDSLVGRGFLSDVVKEWEEESLRAELLGLRLVRMRTGIVLGLGGGALAQMQAAVLGDGKQWMSWVHLDDVVAFIRFALETDSITGVFNLTAPNPETNATFAREFALATGRGPILKVPGILLRLSLGEMASILLDSTFALPARAIQQGFTFRFGRLSEAFRNLYPAPFENRFSAVQFVPRPLEEVFSFFSRAESMEAITPPWIHFRIVKLTSNSLEKGALLDFKLKIHHLPIRCRSLIEGWELRRKFFDGQVKGPYMKWHHACRFERVAGGTLVVDEVVYRLPAGRIGILLGGRMVKNCVHEIFSFRCRKLSEVFPR